MAELSAAGLRGRSAASEKAVPQTSGALTGAFSGSCRDSYCVEFEAEGPECASPGYGSLRGVLLESPRVSQSRLGLSGMHLLTPPGGQRPVSRSPRWAAFPPRKSSHELSPQAFRLSYVHVSRPHVASRCRKQVSSGDGLKRLGTRNGGDPGVPHQLPFL